MAQEKKNNMHLVIISILVIVFLVLLFLSSSQIGVSVNYGISQDIVANSINELENIEIGNVTIINDGMLSKRVKLRNYVICDFYDDYYNSRAYDINYRGQNITQSKGEVFSSSYYGNERVDVNAKTEVDLLITVDNYYYNYADVVKKNNLYGKIISFYLYEMPNGAYSYDYCLNAKKDDAINVINVKLNFDNTSQAGNSNSYKY